MSAQGATRTGRWAATLLTVPAGSGKTLVAGGIIRAGVFEWKRPVWHPAS